MRDRALSLWLPFVAVALLLPPVVLYADKADAVSIPVVESSCGDPMLGWRCFGTGTYYLTTTFDQPDADWTITPILPDDPENWRLINVAAGFLGDLTYTFVFPTPGLTNSAWLDESSFIDSEGRTFFTASKLLEEAFCSEETAGPYTGKWVCGEGNTIEAGASFGETPYGIFPLLDPTLPSLDGPITIHVDWRILGTDVPEASQLNVPAAFYYIFEPVPEPSTGLLVMAGILGLAYQQRRHGRAARGIRP